MLYPPWGPYVDPRCTMEYIPQTFVWGIVHHTLAKGLARAYIHVVTSSLTTTDRCAASPAAQPGKIPEQQK